MDLIIDLRMGIKVVVFGSFIKHEILKERQYWTSLLLAFSLYTSLSWLVDRVSVLKVSDASWLLMDV